MGSVKGYMGIIYAGLIVTAAYNSLAAFLRALGDSKSPLYFLIISAVINVFLDILFIVKIGMGVEGCAYATVIAQAISAVCCLIYIIKKFPILHLKKENFEVSFTEMVPKGCNKAVGIAAVCPSVCKNFRSHTNGKFTNQNS